MSTAASMPSAETSLYDTDFHDWILTTVTLLRQRRFADIDLEHLVEELEDMAKRERRALKSHIRNVILHLLKWRYQPDKRSSSWRQSIRNGRIEIHELLRDSPSLASQVSLMLEEGYPAARADAIDETGLSEHLLPEQCPFTAEQIQDSQFWPEAESYRE